jgi:hypothetical protein
MVIFDAATSHRGQATLWRTQIGDTFGNSGNQIWWNGGGS